MSENLNVVEEVALVLRGSDRVLVFSGAGISTGSGIPDFRGPEGLWTRWRPVFFEEFLSDHQARVRHWEYKLATWRDFRSARPNPGHLALAELDRMGYLDLLVTQNIDGLHQLAGHSEERVVELHGTNRMIECVACGARSEPAPVFEEFAATRVPPRCSCGGFLKPATVSFGQAMPSDQLRRAMEGAGRADFVMAVGSTLEVEPAASVPRFAKEQGAFYVIVNQGETSQDRLADRKMSGDACEILPRLVQLLKT